MLRAIWRSAAAHLLTLAAPQVTFHNPVRYGLKELFIAAEGMYSGQVRATQRAELPHPVCRPGEQSCAVGATLKAATSLCSCQSCHPVVAVDDSLIVAVLDTLAACRRCKGWRGLACRLTACACEWPT